jgi:hypothetical protein
MFLAVGTGAYVAAVFHMVTHAFFKALLFLGSGSVIHGMHDEQDMRRYGGLRKSCRSPRSRSSSAGSPSPACRRSPASGPRTRSSPTPTTTARPVGGRHRHRDPHRLLHEPPGLHDLLRPLPLRRCPARGDRRRLVGPEDRRAGGGGHRARPLPARRSRTPAPPSSPPRRPSWPPAPPSPRRRRSRRPRRGRGREGAEEAREGGRQGGQGRGEGGGVMRPRSPAVPAQKAAGPRPRSHARREARSARARVQTMPDGVAVRARRWSRTTSPRPSPPAPPSARVAVDHDASSRHWHAVGRGRVLNLPFTVVAPPRALARAVAARQRGPPRGSAGAR